MTLFADEPPRRPRSGADWEARRAHRSPRSGPPQDEVGVLALSSFVLARTAEVVVAVRGVTAYSDGLQLQVVVLFADDQPEGALEWSLRDYSRSPGRFRLGVVLADGRTATAGDRDSPDVETPGSGPQLTLLGSTATPLTWVGEYWLWPLPPAGPLVLGCRWSDRAIDETLVQIDPEPLLTAAATSHPVWEDDPA